MPVGYRTMDGIDLNDVWYGGGGAGIQTAVDLYRTVNLPVIDALAMKHDETIMKYGVSEKNGFQLLAPGQRPDRKLVQIATMYPRVSKYGYGVGTDLDTLRRATGREIQLDFNRPFKEDPENILLQYLKAMMIDPGNANKDYGFYNGQFSGEEKITAPPKYQNNTFAATHTHYYTTGAATIALADITKAKQTIQHHGHTGQLVAFINSVEQQAMEDLAAWTGSGLRSPVRDEVAIRGLGSTFEWLGVVWHVTEMIPSGYFLMVEAMGDESERPLVHFEPANIQGLGLFPGPQPDYPIVESFVERWMGVKVVRRGAGVSVQITTGATYTKPTFNE